MVVFYGLSLEATAQEEGLGLRVPKSLQTLASKIWKPQISYKQTPNLQVHGYPDRWGYKVTLNEVSV